MNCTKETIVMSVLAAGVMSWGKEDVRAWLFRIGLQRYSETLCDVHNMDGPALLMLQESDLRQPPLQMSVLGDIKKLVFHLAELRLDSPALGSRTLYCLAPKPSSSYSLASDSSPSRSQAKEARHQESLFGFRVRTPFCGSPRVRSDYVPTISICVPRFRT